MKKASHLTRRQFLINAGAALGGLALTGLSPLPANADSNTLGDVFLPFVTNSHDVSGQVIHVHNLQATSWDNSKIDFWNYVNQSVVNDMVNQGLMTLTGKATVASAWNEILPSYQAGQKIAIKINFNNHRSCTDPNGVIDALPQPVNAVVSSLEQIGVARSDVCVYDAVRSIPSWFYTKVLPNIGLYDDASCNSRVSVAGFSKLPAARVTFYPPAGVTMPAEYVTDVLMNAHYLINMPIMKGLHPNAGVTLGGKNHFGTIHNCGDNGIHRRITLNDPSMFRLDYHPFVDFFRSPLIGGKTVLTVGDGLIAGRQFNIAPQTWTTFNNQVPNSLFFSRDKVAIDCVMHDLLKAELGTYLPDTANNYLRLAGEAGIGVFEQGNPWQTPIGSGYSKVKYVFLEM